MKVLVTGGTGFLGRVVVDRLQAAGYEVWAASRNPRVSTKYRALFVDLYDRGAVAQVMVDAEPDVVIHLASPHTGGVAADAFKQAEVMSAALQMNTNVVDAAAALARHKRVRFISAGSVCAYPANAPVPTQEHHMDFGIPDQTHRGYGLAKRAMFWLQEEYAKLNPNFSVIHLIFCNLYGPGDTSSHFIPDMLRKVDKWQPRAGEGIEVWGDGMQGRSFLYVDDAADAVLLALTTGGGRVNVAPPKCVTLETVLQQIGKRNPVLRWVYDPNSPFTGDDWREYDTNLALAMLHWTPKTSLEEGLKQTVTWWQSRKVKKED